MQEITPDLSRRVLLNAVASAEHSGGELYNYVGHGHFLGSLLPDEFAS